MTGQLPLLSPHDRLDARQWHGSFNARESRLHQLSPYVGKMKSGMAAVLIERFSNPGDVVLDPFSGSGIVALEAVLAGREAWANDLSPYAYALTRGKLEAPGTEREALARVKTLSKVLPDRAEHTSIAHVPSWVRDFFHPDTLRETLAAFAILREQKDYFLTACLLGILHHVRPGFLSYPASHLVPYLRKSKYPPAEYPEMYAYRPLLPRLTAKVQRAFRGATHQELWEYRKFTVWQRNAMQLDAPSESVHAIVSSPPYFGALDYARDNRLRLWFLGFEDWKELDSSLTANAKVYLPQMAACLREMHRLLKRGAACVLVLGDVERDGKTHRTAEILAELAASAEGGGFAFEEIVDDRIPDERRSRRRTRTTKFERILILRKP